MFNILGINSFIKPDSVFRETSRIWDNGIGFNPEKVKQSIGLKNIKERSKASNGELRIISSSGKGTTLEVVF